MKQLAAKSLPATGWVREREVLQFVPFGRTKLREEIGKHRFPSPQRFGPRLKAFDAADVHRWIRDPLSWCPGEKTAVEDTVRVLQRRYPQVTPAQPPMSQRRRVD